MQGQPLKEESRVAIIADSRFYRVIPARNNKYQD